MNREETFIDLCRFLGVTYEVIMPKFDVAENKAGQVRFKIINTFIRNPSRLRSAFGRLIPNQDMRLRVGMWIEKLNTAALTNELDFSGVLDREVIDAMNDDICQMETLARMNLSSWRGNLQKLSEDASNG